MIGESSPLSNADALGIALADHKIRLGNLERSATHHGSVRLTGDTMTGSLILTGGSLQVSNSAESLRLSNSGAYISWWNGATRTGYMQGNGASGIIINAEAGPLNLLGQPGYVTFQSTSLNVGIPSVYGSTYNGLNWGGNYLVMTDGANTFVSAPSSTLFLRAGANSAYQLAVNNTGTHAFTGHLSMSGYDIGSVGNMTSTGYTLNGNNSYYFGTWGGGWYMTDVTYIRATNDKHTWLGNGWYLCNGGMNIGGGGSTGNGINSARLSVTSTTLNGCAFFSAQNVGSWPYQNVVLYTPDGAGSDVGISGYVPAAGMAPVFRFNSASSFGESWDAVASDGTTPIVVTGSSFQAVSTVRVKKDIERLDDDELLERISQVDTYRWMPMHVPMSALVPDGADRPSSEPHDCSKHACEGGHGDPCLVMRNHLTGKVGVTAEQMNDVFPEIVGLDREGLPHSLDVNQTASSAFGGVGALVRKLATLEQRLNDLEAK